MSEYQDDKPVDASDEEGLFFKLKGWFREDYEHTSEWREKAKDDFGFVAGDQWTEEDKQKLRTQLRPVITMNRIDPIIDSVSGSEVSNRQEVRYIPREAGDVKVNEVLTSAAQWFREQCDAEDEESDAFRDTIIGGMGWTETRLDYETEPDGEPKIERVDPLEMVWDCRARKRNLVDARRLFHVRKLSLEEAKALVGGKFEDSDYNASWVDGRADPELNINDGVKYDGDENEKDESIDKRVTLVRAQWWERERVYRILMPGPTGEQTINIISEAQYKLAKKDPTLAGLKIVPGYRRVYKQAYLGSKVLESGDAPCKEHFSFNVITGKRDRNKNAWYGLVRGMRDPQLWANKFFSQMLHIINTTAKGGVLAERGAFDDDKKAEETWSRQDEITWARAGALSGAAPKILPKPATGIPPGIANMMEFAISAIRDVSGVNVETLGMRNSDQAAALDMQRKQASMVILQPLFDSLRRYRKVQGRQMLYLIQNYLSDGRLVRIVGQEMERYAPLVKDPNQADAKFDIIVDDAPTSPNQKEATWTALQQILPAVGKIMPPETWIALLEFSPLPTTAQEKIKKSLMNTKAKPDPEVEKAKMMMELEMAKAQQAMQIKQQEAQLEYQIQMAKAQQELEIEKLKAEGKIKLEWEMGQMKMQQQAQLNQMDMAVQAQQSQREMALAEQTAQQESSLREQEFQRDSQFKDQQVQSDIARRDQAAKADAKRKAMQPKPAAKGK